MKEIEVVGAAIIKDGKVLAAQRSAEMYPPLKWEFPGGKVEKGESHVKALEREIFEELGIIVRVKDFIAKGSHETRDRKITLHVYMADIVEGEPQKKEHSSLEWIGIGEFERLDWAEADIPACREIVRRMRDKTFK